MADSINEEKLEDVEKAILNFENSPDHDKKMEEFQESLKEDSFE